MQKWEKVLQYVENIFGIEPDMLSILYLIGIQEYQQGFKNYSREEKHDLIGLARCKLLESKEFYIFEGLDRFQLPVWKKNPKKNIANEQEEEEVLKQTIIEYFENQEIISFDDDDNSNCNNKLSSNIGT